MSSVSMWFTPLDIAVISLLLSLVTTQVLRLKADLVHLVYLVCLVYLLTQTNQIDRTDQMTRQTCLQPEPLRPIYLSSYTKETTGATLP